LSNPHTTFEIQGPLAVLTFNRPEARNAMTWEMYDALTAACEDVDHDPAIRILILRGAGGKAFIAGTDITQFEGFTSGEDGVQYERRLDEVLDRLERVTKPTIAQVQGVAAGGGCAIALCCDLRIATPESSFGIPIARTLGNCLSADTCNRLIGLIGAARFKEWMFTGRFIHAAEALDLGLVNRIAGAEDIDRAVRELAAQIGSHAPLTIRAVKELTRRLVSNLRLPPDEARDVIEMCYSSADFREGVAAFIAKRPPVWSGR